MKKILIFSMSILCFGCSSIFENPSAFTANPNYRTVTVSWFQIEDLHKICNIPIKEGYTLNGCARIMGDKCVIFTRKYTTMETLGHELRHCFEGQFHD